MRYAGRRVYKKNSLEERTINVQKANITRMDQEMQALKTTLQQMQQFLQSARQTLYLSNDLDKSASSEKAKKLVEKLKRLILTDSSTEESLFNVKYKKDMEDVSR